MLSVSCKDGLFSPTYPITRIYGQVFYKELLNYLWSFTALNLILYLIATFLSRLDVHNFGSTVKTGRNEDIFWRMEAERRDHTLVLARQICISQFSVLYRSRPQYTRLVAKNGRVWPQQFANRVQIWITIAFVVLFLSFCVDNVFIWRILWILVWGFGRLLGFFDLGPIEHRMSGLGFAIVTFKARRILLSINMCFFLCLLQFSQSAYIVYRNRDLGCVIVNPGWSFSAIFYLQSISESILNFLLCLIGTF